MAVLRDKDIAELCKLNPPLVENYLDWEWQLQPAGFDLTVEKIFTIDGIGTINSVRLKNIAPDKNEVTCNESGFYQLARGVYTVQFNELLCIPKNVVGLGQSRSTLLRYGGVMLTGIWDPGFHGRSQCGLIVENEKGINISKNAALLQVAFFELTGESDGFQYNELYRDTNNQFKEL